MTAASPREEYARRRARQQEGVADAARREERISRARLGVALAAVLVAWLVFGAGRLSPWWLVAPGRAFAALLVAHARVRRRRGRAERGVAFYQRGLARLDGQWAGTGRTGTRFADPHHPYADDLDIFGAGSLFELLCAARTSMGEETLAAWLLAPSTRVGRASDRPRCRRWRPRSICSEDLAVLGEEVAATVQRDALRTLAAPARVRRRTRPPPRRRRASRR